MTRWVWAVLLLAGLATGTVAHEAAADTSVSTEAEEPVEEHYEQEKAHPDLKERTYSVSMPPMPDKLPEDDIFTESDYEELEGKAAKEAMATKIVEKEIRQDFTDADKDQSSFLEESEVKQFMSELGLSRTFNWRFFDLNKDGRISYEELHRWAKMGGVGGEGIDGEEGAEDITDRIAHLTASLAQVDITA
eukprot:CAMPEP_0195101034 /NCGR_PEP_ID=MMETSP0448-20130528/64874_1 /TAXON_ID=66468 /ORGANISM="Heterocapsa triquestra, Strain CCMP 448" /LENGTH=190 /DNA_ID=CAMNT_0040136281 /DNA_START=65 /DNA_END=637 /DNA_ORIENTATION=+